MRWSAGRLLRTPRELWERGAVEVGVVGVAAALLLGTVVGTGAASTVVDVADGVTWVSDEDSGQVVEINPSTGRPQRAVQVAQPGTGLTLGQRDGVLVLTDDEGLSTAIDLSTLVASGSRNAGGPGQTKVLVEGGGVYLVELERGEVRAVDPLTLEDLGRPLRTAALSDAVVDDRGTVWTAGNDGVLSSATWSVPGPPLHRPRAPQLRRHRRGHRPGPARAGRQRVQPRQRPGRPGRRHRGGVRARGRHDRHGARPRTASPADVAPVVDRDNATLVVITRHRRVQQISLAATGCSDPAVPRCSASACTSRAPAPARSWSSTRTAARSTRSAPRTGRTRGWSSTTAGCWSPPAAAPPRSWSTAAAAARRSRSATTPSR